LTRFIIRLMSFKHDKLLKKILAVCGGMLAGSLLFLFWFFIRNPFHHTPIESFFSFFLLAGFLEEAVKFLILKQTVKQWQYGILVGLGFGTIESIFKAPELLHAVGPAKDNIAFWAIIAACVIARMAPMLMHSTYTGLLSFYTIKKNRPVFGLILAVLLHTLYDVALTIGTFK